MYNVLTLNNFILYNVLFISTFEILNWYLIIWYVEYNVSI